MGPSLVVYPDPWRPRRLVSADVVVVVVPVVVAAADVVVVVPAVVVAADAVVLPAVVAAVDDVVGSPDTHDTLFGDS